MSTTSNRMLIACASAFLVSSTLVACGVFAAMSRAGSDDPDPRGSDRQAERAAMAVVRPYYKTIGEIGADGGAEPERVDPFVTKDHGSQLAVAFAAMRADGWRTAGRTIIVGDDLIGRRGAANGGSHAGAVAVGLRVCLDVSRTRVIGAFGDDQTPLARADRVPYDVWLASSGATGHRLRVESTRVREELTPC